MRGGEAMGGRDRQKRGEGGAGSPLPPLLFPSFLPPSSRLPLPPAPRSGAGAPRAAAAAACSRPQSLWRRAAPGFPPGSFRPRPRRCCRRLCAGWAPQGRPPLPPRPCLDGAPPRGSARRCPRGGRPAPPSRLASVPRVPETGWESFFGCLPFWVPALLLLLLLLRFEPSAEAGGRPGPGGWGAQGASAGLPAAPLSQDP